MNFLRLQAAAVLLLAACSGGENLAPVSAAAGAGGAGGAGGQGGESGQAGGPAGGGQAGAAGGAGALGKPCVADADCGDDVGCTLDLCDQAEGRCTNTPDDSQCADESACNGAERCDAKLGCRAGEPITCSDGDACTIDRCVEDASGLSCQRQLRDADGDGDGDINCKGKDCDDSNPSVSTLAAEVCGNSVDDNCDGVIDEPECASPEHDTCNEPLLLGPPGTYTMSMAGAKLDTSATCAPISVASLRDVVAGVTVPEGGPQQLDITVSWPFGANAASLGQQCGVAEGQIGCALSQANTTSGGQIARLRAHSIAPGTYPLVLYGSSDYDATITYSLGPAAGVPTNETCGTAAPLAPATPILAPLVGAKADVPMKCGSQTFADLVYRVDLDQAYDVRAFASPADGVGNAVVSVRAEACATAQDEVACAVGKQAAAFARKLGPGPVYVAVSSSTGGDVSLQVTLSPPTEPPPDESCQSSPPAQLAPGKDIEVDLTNHTDDHTFCSTGYIDAAYALTLTETSDVLLIMRTSQATSGAVSLVKSSCEFADLLGCKAASPSPMRVASRGVVPGAYRVVAELNNPTPAELTALVRKATPPVLVPSADDCAEPFVIPPEGGLFQGNTANVNAQYIASCDQGGAPNSPDQILRLDLPEKRRVVLDMNGSAFPTLIDVRKGPECPGAEVDLACTIGTYPQRSFLDLTLEAGTYFLQIDGFNGASGAWYLDVYTSPLP